MAGGNFGGGNGSSISPYLVEDQADLEAVNNHRDAYFRQTENIFCSGDFSRIHSFTGLYDGNRKVIANLNVNMYGTDRTGMFRTMGGTLTRMRLLDSTVNGRAHVGILAGDLVGSGKITYCYVKGSVTAHGGSTAMGALVTNVGGFAGWSDPGTHIFRCAADINVRAIVDNHNKGGFVGHHEGKVEECYSIGSVRGHHDVGGLIGDAEPGSSIINCYSRSSVYSAGEGSGGLVGDHYPASAGVVNCYSTGRIQGAEGVGGLCGSRSSYPDTGPVSSSYWDVNTSGQSSDYSAAQPRNTSQMKQQSNFSGWNFTTIWAINPSINDGYPFLRHVPILADMKSTEKINIQPPVYRSPSLIKSANPVITFETYAPAPSDPLDPNAKPWWDLSWDKDDPPDWIYPDDPDYEEDGPIFRHEVEGI